MNENNISNEEQTANQIAELTMNTYDKNRKSPKTKTIVVHPELYQALILGKGMLAIQWADPNKRPERAPSIPTFADVITEWYNRGNNFAQLMSRIIRKHPELKPTIEKVAKKNPEHFKLVEAMLKHIGKTRKNKPEKVE